MVIGFFLLHSKNQILCRNQFKLLNEEFRISVYNNKIMSTKTINETPILDIKPVMKEFLPKDEVKQPQRSVSNMEKYWG